MRAELTGIGDAGKKGFGKASREMEMEIANAKIVTIQDAIQKYIPAPKSPRRSSGRGPG